MFSKIITTVIAGVILYKLIPLCMGLDGITMLFALMFCAIACYAIHIFFRILNAGTTFRR
jgi:hypothetical protein